MVAKPPQVHGSLSFQGGLGTAEPALGIQLAEQIWGPSVSRTVSLSLSLIPPTLQGSVSQQEPLHSPAATEALPQLGIRQALCPFGKRCLGMQH